MHKHILALFMVMTFIFISCTTKNIVFVTEEELITEFTENPKFASIKYKNTTLQIRGVIASVGLPKKYTKAWDASHISLGYDGGSRNNHIPIVACFFDGIPDILHDLQMGDTVTIQARFSKYYEPGGWKRIKVRHSKVIEVLQKANP